MATITLDAGKVNQMSSLINHAKKAVKEYKSDLRSLKSKVLKIDSGICNVDDVISSIKSSTKTQEDKIETLENLKQDINDFISDVVRIDGDAAEAINKSKDDFYNKYEYLTPECEKSRWEKFKDGCKKVGEWCKEHWKEIVIVIGAVLIITAIVITGFTSLVPLLTFLGLSVKLATVVSVTVCGIAFLASSIYLLGYPLNILGKIFKSDTLKTISFGLRHPIISLQIGKVKPGVGNTNISTNASRFANAFDFEDNDAQEGSEVNAFRHTFWISIITSKWGENIGLQVGNAHEKNQNVIHEIKDIYSHRFKTLGDADQAVDLLNNVIGREIGKTTSIDSTSKDIAKKVLDYYYTNGLNIVKETDDGHYVIVKERLSYERYKDDLIILETLDENGFPPDNKYYNKKGD